MGSSPEDDGPTPTQSTVGSLLSNVQAMERDGEGKVTVLGDETSGDGDAEGDDEGNEDEVREEREVGERTPLLSNGARAKVEGGTKFFEKVERRVGGWVSKARKEVGEVDLAALGPEALRAMPAVILGCVLIPCDETYIDDDGCRLLMNVLDGVSYGMSGSSELRDELDLTMCVQSCSHRTCPCLPTLVASECPCSSSLASYLSSSIRVEGASSKEAMEA